MHALHSLKIPINFNPLCLKGITKTRASHTLSSIEISMRFNFECESDGVSRAFPHQNQSNRFNYGHDEGNNIKNKIETEERMKC